jgi:site-specific recombinase XerD
MGSVELSRAILGQYRAWLEGRLSAASSVASSISVLLLASDENKQKGKRNRALLGLLVGCGLGLKEWILLKIDITAF